MKRCGARFLGREHRSGQSPSAGPLPNFHLLGHSLRPGIQKSESPGSWSESLRSPRGPPPEWGTVCQTCTGRVWFICSRMSWILLRIFFWWPAKVTPMRSRSLCTERGQGQTQQHRGLSPTRPPSPAEAHLLCSHLGYQVKGCKPRTAEALLVPSHLDGIQPVTNRGEGCVVRDCAVQEGL